MMENKQKLIEISQFITDAAHFSSDKARIKNRESFDYQTKLKIMLGNYFISAGNIEKYYKKAMRILLEDSQLEKHDSCKTPKAEEFKSGGAL